MHGLAAKNLRDEWNVNYVDGTHGAETSDLQAALTLGNGHPKCGDIPSPGTRLGTALDPSTSGKPQPGIGVNGALPIGAFQS